MNKRMRSMKRGIKTRKVKGLKGIKVNSFKSGKKINLVGGAVKTFPLVVTLRFGEDWEHHHYLISFDVTDESDETDERNMLNSFHIKLDLSKYGNDRLKERRGLDIPGRTVLDTMYDALANSEETISKDKLAYYSGDLHDFRRDIYKKNDESCKYDKGIQL